MVICHIRVIDTNVRLSGQNHALITQQLQYENLKERIDQARWAKHDMRHHVLLLQSLLEDQKYAAVRVPKDLNIPDNVRSISLGNLLENALEASRHVETGKRKVTIKSVCSGGMILFNISNYQWRTLLLLHRW